MFSDKLSVFFFVLLAVTVVSFTAWGLDYINFSNVTLFVLATAFGLFMAFNIGGNDVANSFGTSVGAGTLTIKQALAVAAVFEVSGAMIAGGAVTDTIRKGIVDLNQITSSTGFDAMARDAAHVQIQRPGPDHRFESDYYRDLYAIERRRRCCPSGLRWWRASGLSARKSYRPLVPT